MAATFVLGAGFLFLEIHEFAGMVAIGAGPTRSAFLSSFFTLVGCHGLHVTLGLLWLLTMMAQVFAKGYRARHPAPHPVLRPVLAYAGHHLGRALHGGLSDGDGAMSDAGHSLHLHAGDTAPGDERAEGREIAEGLSAISIGLGLATLITVVAFFIAISGQSLVWDPASPIALFVLAIAQMGVHLVFFLHITTGPDNANNVLALAFGVLIVLLLIVGSLWIMTHLNHNMMPMDRIMQMQR